MIACIGWGSLVWNPGLLPIDSEWQRDGPRLPIEFVRQSKDGHITLALATGMPLVQSLWATLSAGGLDEAVQALKTRENTSSSRIGIWTPTSTKNTDAVRIHIGDWASSKGMAGVVWTALSPKFGGVEGRIPSEPDVISYLEGLTGDVRAKAEEYVRKTPVQVRTRYRESIELHLGWTPV